MTNALIPLIKAAYKEAKTKPNRCRHKRLNLNYFLKSSGICPRCKRSVVVCPACRGTTKQAGLMPGMFKDCLNCNGKGALP